MPALMHPSRQEPILTLHTGGVLRTNGVQVYEQHKNQALLAEALAKYQ